MNCMPSLHAAGAGGRSLPEKELHGALAPEVRNRQAAAFYLQAATRTDSAAQRRLLRRHAAELILPRLGDRGGPRAC